MTNEPSTSADHPEKLVTDPGNKFVESRSGRAIQSNPQPVPFTGEFEASLDQLTKEVLAAVHEIGSEGRRYR